MDWLYNYTQYWDFPSAVSFSYHYFLTLPPKKDISVFEDSYSDNLIYQKTNQTKKSISFLRQIYDVKWVKIEFIITNLFLR